MWSSQIEPVVFKERGLKKILADIYGSQYGSVKELGLADPATIKEFDSNLDSVKEQWEQLCPGFYKCFVAKRKTLFQEKVIEEVRKESNVYGMYYNNNIKSMHFKETGIIARRNQYIEEHHRNTARRRGLHNLWQWPVQAE